jgi:hypothetical protein
MTWEQNILYNLERAELRRMWNEVIMAYLKYRLLHCLRDERPRYYFQHGFFSTLPRPYGLQGFPIFLSVEYEISQSR